mgnify:CR=1 FL=1
MINTLKGKDNPMRTIKFYRNLNGTCGRPWSYKPHGVVVHATTLVAYNVTIKQPSGQAFTQCLNGGHRAIFAWFKSKDVTADTAVSLPPNAKRIHFNPRRGDTCFHIDGKRVDTLRVVWCCDDGMCYGIE